jgi:putative oxidoreductase
MSSLTKRIFATHHDWAPVVLRLALGVVIFPHGAQKLLGWFGGYGFSGTMGYFTDQVGLPWIIAFLVVIIEFFGSLALIVGAATRLAALGIGAVMAGAVLTVHGKVGFFMNWSGNQSGEGFEFHLLAIGIALALILVGGGRASVDGAISANSG